MPPITGVGIRPRLVARSQRAWRSWRQYRSSGRKRAIASNIARADTPCHIAVDIDFQETLRIARSGTNSPLLTLSATLSGRIPGQVQSSAPPLSLKMSRSVSVKHRPDLVKLDVVRSKFADNSMMWKFSSDCVGDHHKHNMEMLVNLKD